MARLAGLRPRLDHHAGVRHAPRSSAVVSPVVLALVAVAHHSQSLVIASRPLPERPRATCRAVPAAPGRRRRTDHIGNLAAGEKIASSGRRAKRASRIEGCKPGDAAQGQRPASPQGRASRPRRERADATQKARASPGPLFRRPAECGAARSRPIRRSGGAAELLHRERHPRGDRRQRLLGQLQRGVGQLAGLGDRLLHACGPGWTAGRSLPSATSRRPAP